jgi:hypothetical protein
MWPEPHLDDIILVQINQVGTYLSSFILDIDDESCPRNITS